MPIQAFANCITSRVHSQPNSAEGTRRRNGDRSEGTPDTLPIRMSPVGTVSIFLTSYDQGIKELSKMTRQHRDRGSANAQNARRNGGLDGKESQS